MGLSHQVALVLVTSGLNFGYACIESGQCMHCCRITHRTWLSWHSCCSKPSLQLPELDGHASSC